jgi:hypothetical protein
MKKKPDVSIEVKVYMKADHWVIHFPGYELEAKDRTMVRNLIRHYAKEQKVRVHIYWVEHQ